MVTWNICSKFSILLQQKSKHEDFFKTNDHIFLLSHLLPYANRDLLWLLHRIRNWTGSSNKFSLFDLCQYWSIPKSNSWRVSCHCCSSECHAGIHRINLRYSDLLWLHIQRIKQFVLRVSQQHDASNYDSFDFRIDFLAWQRNNVFHVYLRLYHHIHIPNNSSFKNLHFNGQESEELW